MFFYRTGCFNDFGINFNFLKDMMFLIDLTSKIRPLLIHSEVTTFSWIEVWDGQILCHVGFLKLRS